MRLPRYTRCALASLFASTPLMHAVATPVPARGVAGDECLDPLRAVVGLNGPVDLASLTASMDPPASDDSCAALNWTATTRDAWWVFNAPAAGRLSLDFCPSDYDTSVVLYQGSCAGLVRIACDDDGCQPAGPLYQSRIVDEPVAAGPVYIRVGGYAGATGTAQFTLGFELQGGDECTNAVPARLGVNDAIDTSTMTASANVPASADCKFLNWLPGTQDAWWVYHAPTAGRLSLHFCASDFDTSVVVYQGNCGALVRVGCDDDGCEAGDLTFQSKIDGLPVAAGAVFIRVGGWGGDTGTARFTLDFKSEARVVCWGLNLSGQIWVPASIGPVWMAAGGVDHSIAYRADGTVSGWGMNDYGQLDVPPALGELSALAAGAFHNLALRPDGSVVAWGRSGEGQCALPPDLGLVTAVSAGSYHSAALKANGTVACWGSNNYGQSTVPAGLGGVMAIDAGALHNVALRSDGTVTCWGWNAHGQCDVPAGLSRVAAIAGGGAHTVALRSDGSVRCWGLNAADQCTVPAGVEPVVEVAAGLFHTMARKSDGTIACWGTNEQGQSAPPPSLAAVRRIESGGLHSFALIGYTCLSDFDGDGSVGASDLSGLLAAWGLPNPSFDLDGDGSVGASDLSLLLANWGSCGGGA